MLEDNFIHVFEESAKLDMFRVYHHVRQSMAFERRFDDVTESVSGIHMHASFTHRFL